ncbi:MAG: helix-turn-helix domain-containing protein [Candidatus Berkelbacteria bacterium]|nr:helix-turn-helix domain-containing protein [Candidatus Berkelbacteria bacterium]
MNQTQALKILKTGANVFLTGEPGSGKTYAINQYVAYLHSHGIEPAITASTGIAATHIGGMTIHSWSGIGIKSKLSKTDLNKIATNDYVKKRVGKAKILIIDEISMLPPQTLQMVDAICKEVKKSPEPFGGIQVVLVGDFFQLPPVVRKSFNEESQENLFEETPVRFAYDAPVFKQAEFVTSYITEQHRQDDKELVSVLSKIRSNSFDELSLGHIKKRKIDSLKVPGYAPKLYSHNVDVDIVNDRMLAKIPGNERLFKMAAKGHEGLINVMKKGCLSPENLYLKTGASVMFTKNNTKEGFVNGTLGIVEGFSKETKLPIVKIRNGRKIKVSPADWTVEEDGKVRGKLTQIPLRLAWAITVHKSQGISLDEAVIDLSKVFEFGQGYVAISRVRRLSGIYILGFNDMAFRVDPEVLQKDKEFFAQSTDAQTVYSRFSENEFEKMRKDFIVFCDGELDTSSVVSKDHEKKPATYDETLKLWKEGKDIAQIAKIRNLSEGTILGHVANLIEKGKIDRADLVRVVPPNLSRDLSKIHAAFKNLGTDKLSPVFNHFQGRYSYDELKLARMMME